MYRYKHKYVDSSVECPFSKSLITGPLVEPMIFLVMGFNHVCSNRREFLPLDQASSLVKRLVGCSVNIIALVCTSLLVMWYTESCLE